MAQGLHIPGTGVLGKGGMQCSCNENLIQTIAVRKDTEIKSQHTI